MQRHNTLPPRQAHLFTVKEGEAELSNQDGNPKNPTDNELSSQEFRNIINAMNVRI